METEYDVLIRAVAFLFGMFGAGHYFLGAAALKKAAHWEKLVLFPALVVACVGLCFAAVFYGSGMVAVVCMPLAAFVLVKDAVIWHAGAYMSEVLDRRQRMRELEQQAYNLHKDAVMAPWHAVSDLVTPSGFEAVAESERKAKEHA